MSDLVYAMNVSASRAAEQTEQATFAAGLQTAFEAGYTIVTVEWFEGYQRIVQCLDTACVHVELESGMVRLLNGARFHVSTITGMELCTTGHVKCVAVDTSFYAKANGDRTVKFMLVDCFRSTTPIQVARGDTPSFEQTKMVQFEFSVWTAGGSAAVRQMCTVLLNGRQHISCIAETKSEAYKLAFERSVELLAEQAV